MSSYSYNKNRACRIKRLLHRSVYTGTQETDILLGGFAREILPELDDAELDLYETLLDYGDTTIWAWVSKQAEVPPHINNAVLTRLIDWCQGRVLK